MPRNLHSKSRFDAKEVANRLSAATPSRREMLWRLGGGLGGVALASLLGDEGALAVEGARRRPPQAKRVVQLFMSGAASQ
ncbi:MAG: hypothetical protein AAF961_18575, partial [Planctomycetota bacterium]